MKIGLIDVDGRRFPNLALMKISRYYKQQGHDVEWASPILGDTYDRVYKSKVFTFSQDDLSVYPCEVIKVVQVMTYTALCQQKLIRSNLIIPSTRALTTERHTDS